MKLVYILLAICLLSGCRGFIPAPVRFFGEMPSKYYQNEKGEYLNEKGEVVPESQKVENPQISTYYFFQ